MNGSWFPSIPTISPSMVQQSFAPSQPSFWDKLGDVAIGLGQGALQFAQGRQPIMGGPGLPPYNPPPFAPPQNPIKSSTYWRRCPTIGRG